MKIIKNFILFYILTLCSYLVGAQAHETDKFFTYEEVRAIHHGQDYFHFKEMDTKSPIWSSTRRKYSDYFLRTRDNAIDLPMAIHSALNEGYPIRRRLEELYQARMGIHDKIGSVLPHLRINFSDSLDRLVLDAISGLVGFLVPGNWAALIDQPHIYKAIKNMLVKDVLDQVLQTKLAYVTQHQKITDLEILNYYLSHLQVFLQKYNNKNRQCQKQEKELPKEQKPSHSKKHHSKKHDKEQSQDSKQSQDQAQAKPKERCSDKDLNQELDYLEFRRAVKTLNAEFAVQGADVAARQTEIRLGFRNLAFVTGIEKLGDRFSLDNLNIAELTDFPKTLEDMENAQEEIYRNSEVFLEAVAQRSIEIKILKHLVEVNRLNLGISTFEGLIDDRSAIGARQPRDFVLGYGTIPRFLISNSIERNQKLDIKYNHLNILDNARRTFALYASAIDEYNQGKRSLELTRRAFSEHLKYYTRSKKVPDALFITSLRQLIQAELSLNNALHSSLLARARMDRYLLIDSLGALEFLPQKSDIIKNFAHVIREYEAATDKETNLDTFLRKVKDKKKLSGLLFQRGNDPRFKDYTDAEINAGLLRNMDRLLSHSLTRRKSKGFYLALANYISKQPGFIMPSTLREKLHRVQPTAEQK